MFDCERWPILICGPNTYEAREANATFIFNGMLMPWLDEHD